MNKSYIVDLTCNDMRIDRWIRLKVGKISYHQDQDLVPYTVLDQSIKN